MLGVTMPPWVLVRADKGHRVKRPPIRSYAHPKSTEVR